MKVPRRMTQSLVALGDHAPPKLVETLSMISELSSWEAMDALVTGAESFVGSHLVDTLAERGYQPRLFVLRGQSRRLSQPRRAPPGRQAFHA